MMLFISQKYQYLRRRNPEGLTMLLTMSNVYRQKCLSCILFHQYYLFLLNKSTWVQWVLWRLPTCAHKTVYESKFGANFWGTNFSSVLFKLLFAYLQKPAERDGAKLISVSLGPQILFKSLGKKGEKFIFKLFRPLNQIFCPAQGKMLCPRIPGCIGANQ